MCQLTATFDFLALFNLFLHLYVLIYCTKSLCAKTTWSSVKFGFYRLNCCYCRFFETLKANYDVDAECCSRYWTTRRNQRPANAISLLSLPATVSHGPRHESRSFHPVSTELPLTPSKRSTPVSIALCVNLYSDFCPLFLFSY